MPEKVAELRQRAVYYRQHTASLLLGYSLINQVIPCNYFEVEDDRANFDNVWMPWLTSAEDESYYPTNYTGDGYPTQT